MCIVHLSLHYSHIGSILHMHKQYTQPKSLQVDLPQEWNNVCIFLERYCTNMLHYREKGFVWRGVDCCCVLQHLVFLNSIIAVQLLGLMLSHHLVGV